MALQFLILQCCNTRYTGQRMSPVLVIAMWIFSVADFSACARPHQYRIYNGQVAMPGEYPYQVSLQKNKRHVCGATLISPQWILTAAHCFLSPGSRTVSTKGNYSILAGTIDLRKGGIRREVKDIKLNNFDGVTAKNDIALLKLSSSVPYSKHVRAVELPTGDTEVASASEVTVIGWGKTQNSSNSPLLRTVDIEVYDIETCRPLIHTPPNEGDICAGLLDGGKGACVGDSGGPLLINGVQEGIVSWGSKNCAELPFPLGVYTNVARYMDWIKDTVRGHHKHYFQVPPDIVNLMKMEVQYYDHMMGI